MSDELLPEDAAARESDADILHPHDSCTREKQAGSGDGPDEPYDMPEKVSALEAQLREKEQLVSALTERLEQAAEQLDRHRRTGADRSMRSGSGFPPELIEQQKNLVEELQHAVERWEDMHAATTLGNLEIQITELRDLVAGRIIGGDRGRGLSPSAVAPAEDHTPPETLDTPSGSPADSDSTASSYEALKAGLLDASSAESSDEQIQATDTVSEEAEKLEDIEPVALPQPIDVAAATLEELSQAVQGRDSYISFLIKKLRAAETRHLSSIDWQTLEHAPEQLKQRLEELQSQFEENLRLAEVELSLERARLGREEARLRSMEQQLEKEVKRLGLDAKDEADEDASAEDDGTATTSRWLKFLARRKTDDATDDV